MDFSRQEHLSGSPFPPPGDLPHPGIEPWSPTLQADALTTEPPGKPDILIWYTANDNVHIVFQYVFLLILFYLFTVGNII